MPLTSRTERSVAHRALRRELDQEALGLVASLGRAARSGRLHLADDRGGGLEPDRAPSDRIADDRIARRQGLAAQ